MKKILGILAGMILIFGLLQGTVLYAQTSDQNQLSEKEKNEILQKLAQDMALLNLSIQLETEKEVTEEIIKRLEKFQTDNATLGEKISKSWLPTLKEYLKAVGNTLTAVEKFIERRDFIPSEEIETELAKHYSPEIEVRINRVLEEMNESGMLQKLQK